MEYISIMILKTGFHHITIQKQKMANSEDYKNTRRSPYHYSLQIDEFGRGFSNRKPLGG